MATRSIRFPGCMAKAQRRDQGLARRPSGLSSQITCEPALWSHGRRRILFGSCLQDGVLSSVESVRRVLGVKVVPVLWVVTRL